jgi:iron complex outermembrane receptor protein
MKSVVLWGRGTAAACLAAALMVGIEPSVAQAAGEPSDQEAPVVVVDAVEVKGKRIENVEDVKQELARRPGSNILIEEKQITESRAINLQDVLQFAPGVRFQSRFGADEGQFQIRGTSLRNNFHHRGINILINGIFFGDADGFSDFESIDLLAYERIEVYKGANALRYGANSIGGAINFVPRTGYSASTLQMRMLGGSFGMVSGQVSSGKVLQPFKVGNMSATMDYYISVSGNRQDGFRTTVSRPANASMPTSACSSATTRRSAPTFCRPMWPSAFLARSPLSSCFPTGSKRAGRARPAPRRSLPVI